MHLSNRQSKIIAELLSNDNCITGQYLANITGITPRTIRGDISVLNKELYEEGMRIQSISGKGYFIPKDKREALRDLIINEQDYVMPILPNTRVEHIIKHLLYNPKGITLNAIEEQIYISKSTLDRDLEKVSKRLQKDNITLSKKQNNIICIEGEESAIREWYRDLFVKAVRLHSLDKNTASDDIREIFANIKELLIEALEKSSTNFSGDEFDSTIIFLTVVVFRNLNGFTINNDDKKIIIENKFANTIIDMLNLQIHLNNSEHSYIKYYINKLMGMNEATKSRNEIVTIISECITELEITFNCKFTRRLSESLLKTLSNIHYIKASEFSLSEIKKEYPLAFEMTVSLVSSINHKIHLQANDEILMKIVLAFAYEMELDTLNKEQKKRDVVIVCQSGESTNNVIKIKLKRYFPGFNILGFYPLYKLEQALQLQPEIIISTIMVDNENIPVVVINPLFKDYDVIKMDTIIKQIDHKESSSYEFINLFKEDLFVKDFDAFDKHDVIKRLYDSLQKRGYVDDGFFQAVVDRENISSTAIGNMVAVPHAISNAIGENVVVTGILKKPINWNGEKVQLVFLINIQNVTDGNVKQIFKSFFDVISSNGKVERLIKSKNYYEFMKAINQ